MWGLRGMTEDVLAGASASQGNRSAKKAHFTRSIENRPGSNWGVEDHVTKKIRGHEFIARVNDGSDLKQGVHIKAEHQMGLSILLGNLAVPV